MTEWSEIHQPYEKDWWGDCCNTIDEDTKQMAYAKCLGLRFTPDEKRRHRIDLQGRSVIDIGGGPTSLLLKCFNRGKCAVVDPCEYPAWVQKRYADVGIEVVRMQGERLDDYRLPGVSSEILFMPVHDEVWLYNCLEHVEDPAKVAANALRFGKIVRVAEGIGTLKAVGHPQSFTAEQLDALFKGEGKVTHVKEYNVDGLIWHGIFKGDSFQP